MAPSRLRKKPFAENLFFDFSTTVHQPGQSGSQSVEFVVSFATLLCYEKCDCTGQELIIRSTVLINGERVALDLQRAEAEYAPH